MVKLIKIYIFFLSAFSIIKVSKSSSCLDNNIIETPTLSVCSNATEDNSTNYNISCCLLTIKQEESKSNIYKCIEIMKDEDEIEKRIEAFHVMFKNAEEISIECEQSIYIKSLSFILIIFIFLL